MIPEPTYPAAFHLEVGTETTALRSLRACLSKFPIQEFDTQGEGLMTRLTIVPSIAGAIWLNETTRSANPS